MITITEYTSKLGKVFVFLVATLSLLACETSVSPEGLQLIGQPPNELYIDAEFAFQFGVEGGNGLYSYRYVQNPEPETSTEVRTNNHVIMSIENSNAAKSSFWLRGTPGLPSGVSFENVGQNTLFFGIEVSDGSDTLLEQYSFQLKKNKLSFSEESLVVTESRVATSAAETVNNIRKRGLTTGCLSAASQRFERRELPNGQVVYPATYLVTLDRPTATKVELFYRFNSSYDATKTEVDNRNKGYARPNIDYVADEVRSVVFEAGERVCIFYVDVIDDALIEGDETLEVEFFQREGGFVDFSGARQQITIKDNEPEPAYETETLTVNEGQSIVKKIRINTPYQHDLNINVGIDPESSTADEADFELVPQGGVVVLEAGTTEASYTINIQNNNDVLPQVGDDLLVINTSLDNLLDVEPQTFSINAWPKNAIESVDGEVIADTANFLKANDFEVDSQGTVLVALEDFSLDTEEAAVLRAYYPSGDPQALAEGSELIFKQEGLSLKPKAVVADSQADRYTVAVVMQTNGLFLWTGNGSRQYRGGQDFIVAILEKIDDGLAPVTADELYTLKSVSQFGTEGDDIVAGATMDSQGVLYVFGKTDGLVFDGVPSEQGSSGAGDGFVYRILSDQNQKSWSSFVGTADIDGVVGLATTRSGVATLVETINSDVDAFVRDLRALTGKPTSGFVDPMINATTDDNPAAITLGSNGSSYRVAIDSPSSFPSGDLTPTLSRDVALISYNSEGGLIGASPVATNKADYAVDIQQLDDDEFTALAGNTNGEFEGNLAKGASGSDAFVATFETKDSASPALLSVTQFGTPGSDYVIDVEPVNDYKYMILWSEDYSSGDGSTRYRISPFTPQGEKLTADP